MLDVLLGFIAIYSLLTIISIFAFIFYDSTLPEKNFYEKEFFCGVRMSDFLGWWSVVFLVVKIICIVFVLPVVM
jgi:hypothetical protein